MHPLLGFLYGETPLAPVLMAAALVVAFLGSIGIGVWVVSHTPDAFRTRDDAEIRTGEETPRAA